MTNKEDTDQQPNEWALVNFGLPLAWIGHSIESFGLGNMATLLDHMLTEHRWTTAAASDAVRLST
jgi:hypothetical protein